MALAGAGVFGLLAGCSGFGAHRRVLTSHLEHGDYAKAAEYLDQPETIQLYGRKNRLLYDLDRGAIALAQHQPDAAIEHLERAERRIDLDYQKSLSDQTSAWLLNDAATEYTAHPYEDMYVNVLKLLAQFEAGRIVGGATVEARRMATKANLLRDRYLEYERRAGEQGVDVNEDLPGGEVVSVNNAGRFIESPLGTFLTGVAFMKSGDRELQRVAGRRFAEAARVQRDIVGPIDVEQFGPLGDLRPDEVQLLVVALSGQGPTMRAERFGPIPIGRVPVYVELPVLEPHPSDVAAVRLEMEQDGATRLYDLAFVEDLGRVAEENHRRELPLIRARALIRAAAKSGIAYGVGEAARRSASDSDEGWVQVVGLIAGLIAVTATEEADTRCWVSLPGRADAGVFALAPGAYRARTVYFDAGGRRMHETPWRDIDIEGGSPVELATVIERYWR